MKYIRRKADMACLCMIITGMSLAFVPFVLAQTQPAEYRDSIAAVEINALTDRVNRMEKDASDRFNRIETQNQYILAMLFVNMGAHGMQYIRRSAKGNPLIITPRGAGD